MMCASCSEKSEIETQTCEWPGGWVTAGVTECPWQTCGCSLDSFLFVSDIGAISLKAAGFGSDVAEATGFAELSHSGHVCLERRQLHADSWSQDRVVFLVELAQQSLMQGQEEWP